VLRKINIFATYLKNDRTSKLLTKMPYLIRGGRLLSNYLTRGTSLKVVIISVILSVSTTGCERKGFTVSGRIEGAGNGDYILLREVKPNLLVTVDSVIPSRDGSFEFRSEIAFPSFFLLSMGGDNFLTLLVHPGDKINITAGAGTISSPSSVTGSEATNSMLRFRRDHDMVIGELERLTKAYNDSIGSNRLPVIMDSLDRKAAGIVADFREKAIIYLDENKSSMVSIFLLNQQVVPGLQLFDPAKEPDLFYRADSMLYALYPESDLVLDLHTFVARLRRSVSFGSETDGSIGEGDLLPDIALPGPDGDTIMLSSLRGSIVLVDFWAAWCPPCREENPNLVRLYDIYHYRGFDIFQVSLDIRKEEWTEAIRKDRVGRWKHVSDLKYRDSEVVKRFGLTEIPCNYLIDRDGRVIAINLRGEMLQKKLVELFDRQ
jgi:peroxiredoxin